MIFYFFFSLIFSKIFSCHWKRTCSLAEKIFCLFWKLAIWIWRWNKSKTKSSNSMIYEFANLQSTLKHFLNDNTYFTIFLNNPIKICYKYECIFVIRTFNFILFRLKFLQTVFSWLHYSSWSKWLHWLPKLENLKKNFR